MTSSESRRGIRASSSLIVPVSLPYVVFIALALVGLVAGQLPCRWPRDQPGSMPPGSWTTGFRDAIARPRGNDPDMTETTVIDAWRPFANEGAFTLFMGGLTR
jgi:hypothetical protein